VTPDHDDYYVLIWREESSRRLRTYTSSSGRPLASPYKHIFPAPERAFSFPDELNAWLNSPVTDEVVAVLDELARSELGWDPQVTINAKEGYDETNQS
jgi:hypothetical protein